MIESKSIPWPRGAGFAQIVQHGTEPSAAEWEGPKDWAVTVTRDVLKTVTPEGEWFGKYLHKVFPWPMKIVAASVEVRDALILVRTDV